MKNQIINSDNNPLYDRECDDPFVYSDIYDTHTSRFVEVMVNLDSLHVPSACDWYVAMAHKRLLESLGYRLEVGYPFDTVYDNAYERYLWKLGYDAEAIEVSHKAYDEFMSMSEVEPEFEPEVELPF